MARKFKTGILITGDAKGAVNAINLTQAEIKQLRLEQTRSNRTFASGVRQLRGFAVGLTAIVGTGAAAVGSIGGLTKTIADNNDHLQKAAIRLSTTTEFLSGMSHAADLTGTSLDVLEKGMKKMPKTIADGEAGLSTYTRAFDRIGLKAEDLADLSPEDQFLEIAEAVKNTADQTERMAAVQDIFGAKQAELMPLLLNGKEGIQGMREEAERYGLVVSRELADASAQFNDDLTRMKALATGAKNEFAEGLIPQMVALVQHFTESAEASDGWSEAGERVGKVARTIVSAFVVVKESAGFVGEALLGLGANIVHSLQAIAAPFTEFIATAARASKALAQGEFRQAAAEFDGLGERIVESAREHSKAAGEALGFVGESFEKRVGNVLDKVGDIMTRQADINQELANTADEAAEENNELADSFDKLKRAGQGVVNRLFPLQALARQYAADQEAVKAALGDSPENADMLAEALRRLREEYIDATLAAGGLEEIVVKTSKRAIPEMEKTTGELTTALQRGVERMDDLFADLWKGIIDGGKDAFDSLERWFKDLLAEMAHAALTRPIVVSITGAMSGTASAGTGSMGQYQQLVANSLGGFLPFPTGGQGGGSGAGGAGGAFSGLYGAFGQTQGAGFSWQGFNNSAGGTALGAAAGYYGGTALGNLIDDSNRLDGPNYAEIGSQVGAVAGAIVGSLIPVIGTALGALIGGLLGGIKGGLFGKFFGRDFEGAFGGSAAAGVDPEDQRFTTPLGEVVSLFGRGGFGHVDDPETFSGAVREAITALDESIAGFLDSDQLASVTEALKNWTVEVNNPDTAAEDILASRIDAVLGAFDGYIADFVNQAEGIEERVERLNVGLAIERLFKDLGDTLGGRSFSELTSVVEAMRGAGEDWNEVMQRFLQDFRAAVEQIDALRVFVASDPAADYRAILADANRSLFATAGLLRDSIRDLGADFDGSAESVSRLSVLTRARYQTELELLGQIDDVSAQVVSGFASLRDQLLRLTQGDERFYEGLRDRADALSEDLQTMTDPAQIQAAVAEIQRLTGQAWSVLSPEQQAALGGEFLSFIDGVTALSQDRLAAARDTVLGEGAALRDDISTIVATIADPLALVASMHEGAADALLNAAQALEGVVTDPQDGFTGVGQPPGGGTRDDQRLHSEQATADAIDASSQVAADVATASAAAMVEAVDRMGDKIAREIGTAVRGINFQIRLNNEASLVNS